MNKTKRKIVCLNTNEVFDSIKEASEKYNINNSNIYKCCNGRQKSGGRINGQKAIWMYYNDYLKLSDNEVKNILNIYKYNKKVICLNNKEVFNSHLDAGKKHIIDPHSIIKCCNKNRKSAGKINNENAYWMYYDEYLNLSNEEAENILNSDCYKHKLTYNSKKIICLNTNEIFDSATKPSKKYNINRSNIITCCNRKCNSAGIINNEKAIWMYYDEYLNLLDEDIKNILNKSKIIKPKEIICLNNKEVFSSHLDASKKYPVDSHSIIKCCNKTRKSAGKINGEKAYWMYYDEYLDMKKD